MRILLLKAHHSLRPKAGAQTVDKLADFFFCCSIIAESNGLLCDLFGDNGFKLYQIESETGIERIGQVVELDSKETCDNRRRARGRTGFDR